MPAVQCVHVMQDVMELEEEQEARPATQVTANGIMEVPRPQFDFTKRNIWLGRARPKRLPRDEMETCTCSVIKGTEPGSACIYRAADGWLLGCMGSRCTGAMRLSDPCCLTQPVMTRQHICGQRPMAWQAQLMPRCSGCLHQQNSKSTGMNTGIACCALQALQPSRRMARPGPSATAAGSTASTASSTRTATSASAPAASPAPTGQCPNFAAQP